MNQIDTQSLETKCTLKITYGFYKKQEVNKMITQLKLENFEEYARETIEEFQIPGAAVGLSKNGERIYEKGFGWRDKEKQLPVTMDTVFGIASVTKSFSCAAIMQLQEAGKLNVHNPVVEYLPGFSKVMKGAESVTIHHLMTHTAGLPPLASLIYANKRTLDADSTADDYPGIEIKDSDQEPIDTYDQLLDYIGNLEFESLGEPGTEFSYSNDSYALLGAIVEKVTGLSFEEYLKLSILEPAGMKNTSAQLEDLEKLEKVTRLYATTKKEAGSVVYEAPVWWDAPAMRAAGYIKSTVEDMLKYGEMYLNQGKVGEKQILSPESIKEMFTPFVETTPGKFYGYGFMITPDYHGATLVEHGGSLKAISSLLVMVPERRVAGMILTNLAGVPAGNLLHAALNEAEGRDIDDLPSQTQHEEYPLAKEKLADYEGTYSSMEGMSLKIKMEGEELVCETQETAFPLKYTGNDSFKGEIKKQKEFIRFIRDEGGSIKQVAYHLRQFPREG